MRTMITSNKTVEKRNKNVVDAIFNFKRSLVQGQQYFV